MCVKVTPSAFHTFCSDLQGITLPRQFTNPFHYTPHPLCIVAVEEVQTYLSMRKEWKEELDRGKMFGVLVVQTADGSIGYLAAFSGNLAGRNNHPFFVPPVYDLLQPDGFFRVEEEKISTINAQIALLESNTAYHESRAKLSHTVAEQHTAIASAKAEQKEAKKRREERRLQHPDEQELAGMIRESQFQKAELKRLERYWQEKVGLLQTEVTAFEKQIERMKTERKTRSAALQQKLFEQFRMLNALGEEKDLCTLFEHTAQRTPPAGTGECAAPKLLQYAYANGWKPLAMAEFWWGNSPKTELRRHGYYYPACKGKCEPILKHMLQGLHVEKNLLSVVPNQTPTPRILFEDACLLVIDKPADMLSVPGKGEMPSVYEWVRTRYPQATGPLIVHRLDMATSGLLLIAKSKEVHQHLQAQFQQRTIKKRYVALLDGLIASDEGVIDLPLCPDPSDRPRQVVNYDYGKPATTYYKVTDRTDCRTRVLFYPVSGRTHQLRVHAAHTKGLNCPIVGDELYGKKADRLYLHAEQIEFQHPVSGESIRIEHLADF